MQHDDRPLLRCQKSECVIERSTVDDGGRNVRGGRKGNGQGANPRGPTSVTSRFDVAGMDHDPVQPRIEPFGISQVGEVAPGAQEGLLGGVLCAIGFPKDPVREGVAATDVLRRQGSEGLLVALRRPLHEFPLHVPVTSGAARLAASPSMGPPHPDSFISTSGGPVAGRRQALSSGDAPSAMPIRTRT